MSREIDERVVKMQFDKGQFEKGIQTSIHSLDELKKSLDLENAAKGFDELNKAARNVDISALGRAAEQVQIKFGMLEVFALRVMTRISDAAINAGEKLVKSLTIDQITPGWDKYADKTTSVKTIMAATAKQFTDTGEQMEFVNNQLDKLNWFTDETSYNFTDMVNNIGKFTSNNIPLDQSVTAMQGIANWAAISGANAGEASRTMYNLSQAISSGSLRLQDWMSIENANMGTAAFKEMAIQSGLAAGTLVKNGDKILTANKKVEVSVENFRETLSEKWLNGDVLMSTLNEYGAATNKLNEIYEETGVLTSDIVSGIEDYTVGTKTAAEVSEEWGVSLEKTQEYLDAFNNDTMQFGLKAFRAAQEATTFSDAINSVKDAVSTGWMKSFEYIFGDYNEAKKLWTDLANNLYDIFAEGGNARNEMLKEWKNLGGRDAFVEAIWAGLDAILNILGPIKAAWDDTFGIDANKLYDITVGIRDLFQSLTASEETMAKIQSTAKIFFSSLSIIGSLVKAAASAFAELIKYFLPFGDGILSSTASLGEFISELDATIKESQIFDKIFGKIVSTITGGIDKISEFYRSLFKNKDGFSTAAPGIEWFTDAIINLIKNGFERFIQIGHAFRNVIDMIVQSITSAIPSTDNFADAVFKLFESFSNPFGGFNFEKALDLINAGLFTGLILTIKKAIKSFSTLKVGVLLGSFKDFLNGIGESIETFQAKLKTDMLRSIAVSILILAAALAVMAAIDSDRLTASLGATVALFAELFTIMLAFNKLIDSKGTKGIIKLGPLLIALSIAVLILASAVKKLADLDYDGLANGLAAISVLMGELVIVMLALGAGQKKAIKGAVGIILFATAIRILVSSVKALSTLDWDSLIKGLVGVGALMAELSLFISATSAKFKITTGVGLITLSAAILILTQSIQQLAILATGQVFQGLASLGAIFIELSLFINSLSGAKNVLSTSVAIVILSSAIKGLSASIITLGSTDPAILATGLLALGAALTEVVIAMKSLPNDLLGKSAGLFIVATAISILSKAFISLGDISSLATAMISFGWAIIVMVKATNMMNQSVKGAAAVAIFAGALLVLAPAIKMFGNMNLGEIITMIVGLGGALTVLGLAAKILSPLTPAIQSLSLSIALFSGSVLLLGAGITMLSVGLTALGPAAIVGVGGLTVALLEIVNIIPSIVEALGRGIILFANVIIEGAPAIAKAVTTLIISTLESIAETAPLIVDLVIDIITQVIAAIAGRMDDLREAGKMLFGGFSEGVASGIKDIVTAISLLIPSIVGAVKLLGGSKGMEKGAMSTLLGMIAIIGAIGLLLIAFSHIPMGNINNAITISTGVAILMPVLAASYAIMSKFGGKVNTTTVGQFAIMSAIAVSVGALIATVGMIPGVDNAIKVSEALSVLMPILAASFVILTKFGGSISWTAIAQFGVISAIAIAAGAVVIALGNIEGVEHAIDAATAIGTMLIPLALVVAILNSPIMSALGASWSALAMLGVIVAVIGAVAIGIGALMKNPDFQFAIMNAETGMVALGNAIGGFVGGIVGGLVYGALSFLPELGKYLSNFMTEAQVFFDGAKNIPDNLGENVKNIAMALLALTAADLLNGITNFASFLFGGNADNLVEKFSMFGEAISAFSDSITDTFDPDKVQAAAIAGKALSELESNLPKQGGVLQDWLGSQDLGQFGERIKAFGSAIVGFAEEVSELDPSIVDAAATAGSTLVELENKLPRQDGFLQDFLGSQSFSNFGPGLIALGKGLNSFSESLEGVSIENIEAAATCIETLVTLENQIEASGGWGELFSGKSDFSSFGDHVKKLGEALVSYNGSLVNLNLTKMKDVNEVVKKLINIAEFAGTYGSNLSSFASNLEQYRIALSNYGQSITSVDTIKMENVRSAIEKLLRLSELTDAIKWISTVVSHAQLMIKRLIESVQAKERDVRKAGEDLGKWLVLGVKKGIDDNTSLATISATTLGDKIQNAFESRMLISSPSLVMKEDGIWIVKGLAEGITKETSAEEAIKQKAQNLAAAFDAEISKFSSQESRYNLLLRLWKAMDGYSATESEVSLRQYELDKEKLANLAKTVNLRKEELRVTEEIAGKASAEYTKAETAYLEALADLKEFEHEINKSYESFINGEKAVFERKEKTADLELQLWKLTKGLNATEAEIAVRQQKIDAEKLANLSKEVNLREQALAVIEQQYGVQSIMYEEGRQQLLQAQIDQQIAKQKYASNYGSPSNSYYSLVNQMVVWEKENAEAYEMLGYTKEKLQGDALKKFFKLTDEDLIRKKASENINNGDTAATILMKSIGVSSEGIAKTAQILTGWESGWEALMKNVVTEAYGTAEEIIAQNASAYNFNDIYDNLVATTAQITADNVAVYWVDSAKSFDAAAAEVIQNTLTANGSKTRNAAKSAGEGVGTDYVDGLTNSITDSSSQNKFFNSIQNGVLGPLTDTVTSALGISSPSKVAFSYGNYYMEGFANGLEDNLGLIEESMDDMINIIKRYIDYAQSLINSVLNSISDMSPTITPVIDMDSIKKQVSSISTTVSGGLSSSTSKAIANSISTSKSSSTNQNGIAGVPASKTGTTNYNFTQNNYSPKALSRTEIYRQTSNQFSQIKEATKR